MFASILRPVAALAALSGLAAYAAIMLRGPQGLNALVEKHREIRALQISIDRLQHEVDKLKVRNQHLETDPVAQEVELERMGYMHRHDTRFTKADPSVQVPVGGVAAPSTASKP